MEPTYGCRDYIVRDLRLEENSWWGHSPTTLAPGPGRRRGHRGAVADRRSTTGARTGPELAEAGEAQLALHEIDVIALAPGDDEVPVEARAFKAELCRSRAGEIRPYVSKACLRSSARLLDDGSASWTTLA